MRAYIDIIESVISEGPARQSAEQYLASRGMQKTMMGKWKKNVGDYVVYVKLGETFRDGNISMGINIYAHDEPGRDLSSLGDVYSEENVDQLLADPESFFTR